MTHGDASDTGPAAPSVPDVPAIDRPGAGDVLAGRYELLERAGTGDGAQQTWRGRDVLLRRPVAIVLRYPGGPAAAEMLEAAVTTSRVPHPHLADVYDAIDEETHAYVVREWVDGGCLREHVEREPLEVERAVRVARAMAEAVAELHAHGVSHGNIHPGTVLIGPDGRILLCEARPGPATDPDGAAMSDPATGSDRAERATEAEQAARDGDVRAVGGVLYCALTGRWPYPEPGPGAAAPPPVDEVRADVPAPLADLATGLVDPDRTPPPAGELAARLAGLDAQDEPFFVFGDLLDAGPERRPDAVPEPPRPIARKLALGAASLLVLAVIGVLLATQVLPDTGRAAAQERPPAPGAAQAGTPRPVAAQPKPLSIAASQVRDVAPKGDRGEGNAANAVDGNESTLWKTHHYFGSPDFGKLKPGVGVLIDLSSPRPVTSVEVDFAAPGATVQLYTGGTDPGNSASGDAQILASYAPVGTPSVADGARKVLNADGQSVRYLLVWISRLPDQQDAGGGYIAEISEIRVSVLS